MDGLHLDQLYSEAMTPCEFVLSAYSILDLGKDKDLDTKWKQLLLRKKYIYLQPKHKQCDLYWSVR